MEKQVHTLVFDARMAVGEPSGIQRYTRSLLRALIPQLADDERLHVVTGEAESPWLPDHPSVTVHPLLADPLSRSGRVKAQKLIRSLKPQVTHAPSAFTPVRIPGRLVLTLHDLLPVSHPRFSSVWSKLLWRFTAFRAIHRARRLIGSSSDTLRTCAKFFGRRILARGIVIPPGIDPIFHPQPDEAVEAFRKARHLPDRFLLYVGSDEPHKNLSTLLHAQAESEPTASIPLVFAGFDRAESAIPKEADQLELDRTRVIWLPRIPDGELPLLYAAARIFLFPSLVEGFCFPVLEAMACGTPVICSALPVLKEVTAGAAKVVHPTDRQEWSKAIHTANVSLDWHDTYRAKGLARAAALTWEKAAAETLAVYRQLYPKFR
ncbi:MAG: glycosyltransferase family 4 protein [Kiritimatiellae bacterium]|nr:glycosyltransferase family 4 protein [Kiritimatiellia bacterium]